ncbi:CoA pyrophosphatase [Magnetospira sp. QH-2]|uniref:CoA pyrophosphatase n=1 Tax=Magnetospira sp. (strain QH-2) TaxID=1288970 RepID=UPI0003E81AD2|nr:CoA pyrophosphatase [Magnetospira sp. QH-2]CCQ72729.1 Putative Nudix hydrolase [Magnetospira sp. QH-2]
MNRQAIIERFTGGAFSTPDEQLPPPRGDRELNPHMRPKADLCPAAVLIPLVDRTDGLTVLLTQRTDHLEHHPGQISFPGGRIEDIDVSGSHQGAINAALRETEEEVGLHRRQVSVIGLLDDYETRTGFRVTPVVGIISPPFTLRLDPFEVAQAFEVPLDHLLDPANHQRHRHTVNGAEHMFHAMPYEDHYIWGATAGMLMSLYEFLNPGTPA